MYVADRDFLIMCIRTISGDSELLMNVNCPSCDSEVDKLVNLKELDVYEWDENEPVEITVDLPRGFYNQDTQQYNKRVRWGFPKGVAQERLASLPENEMGTNLIAIGLRSVDGRDSIPSSDEVRRLSVRDRGALADAIVENMVGVETKIEMCCDACGHEFDSEVNTVGFSNLGQRKTQKRSSVGTNGRRKRKLR